MPRNKRPWFWKIPDSDFFGGGRVMLFNRFHFAGGTVYYFNMVAHPGGGKLKRLLRWRPYTRKERALRQAQESAPVFDLTGVNHPLTLRDVPNWGYRLRMHWSQQRELHDCLNPRWTRLVWVQGTDTYRLVSLR